MTENDPDYKTYLTDKAKSEEAAQVNEQASALHLIDEEKIIEADKEPDAADTAPAAILS